jgi:hypothetical protein
VDVLGWQAAQVRPQGGTRLMPLGFRSRCVVQPLGGYPVPRASSASLVDGECHRNEARGRAQRTRKPDDTTRNAHTGSSVCPRRQIVQAVTGIGLPSVPSQKFAA